MCYGMKGRVREREEEKGREWNDMVCAGFENSGDGEWEEREEK